MAVVVCCCCCAVQLWASSKVLGRSSMKYFMDRMVPKQKKAAFIRCDLLCKQHTLGMQHFA